MNALHYKRTSLDRILDLVIFSAVAVLILASFTPGPDTHDQARVNKYQGMYVFIQSAPLSEYTVLGTVKKTGMVMSSSPSAMFNTLCKKALKEYDDAQGIIFDDIDMEHATVIKFK